MKLLFIKLLVRFSKTEKQRIGIQRVLFEQVTNEYSEQTTMGNVYNANIEFLMANPVVEDIIGVDKELLKILKSGLETSTDESFKFIEDEIIRPKMKKKKNIGNLLLKRI